MLWTLCTKFIINVSVTVIQGYTFVILINHKYVTVTNQYPKNVYAYKIEFALYLVILESGSTDS